MFFVVIAFEIVVMIGILFGLYHEDKLILFEDILFSMIREKVKQRKELKCKQPDFRLKENTANNRRAG